MAMAVASSSVVAIGRSCPLPAHGIAQRLSWIRVKGLSMEIQKCRSVLRIQQPWSSRILAMAEDAPEESVVATTDESPEESAVEAVDSAKDEEGSSEKREEVAVKPRVKGFTRYETMAVLRPDITEEQRLALSQRYEEMIIAGGGMDVEIFNRGIMPLAYGILKKNTRGEKNTYVDGIFYMFTFATKPSSMKDLQRKLETDDDIIRVSTFKMK